ncbi:hypothetical protein CPB85DRAFT_251536 [Mucidula mucida]|nr:hypothetical protein CPB85DRAFT_251536 [Mucidula mucida]
MGTCSKDWYHNILILRTTDRKLQRTSTPEHVSAIQVMQCPHPRHICLGSSVQHINLENYHLVKEHHGSSKHVFACSYEVFGLRGTKRPRSRFRLSTFIANICLAILIKYSSEDVIQAVGVVLLQVYSILLVTFISMWRNKPLSRTPILRFPSQYRL